MARNVFVSYPKSGRTWFRYIFELAGLRVNFSHAGSGLSLSQTDFGKLPSLRLEHVRSSRAILLHRHPIDTAVSLYFHVHHRTFRRWTWARARAWTAGVSPPTDLISFLDDPAWGVERVCRYNRIWLDYIASNPVDRLIVRYEDMKQDPAATLGTVLGFYQPLEAFDVKDLVERSTFDRMKATASDGGWRLRQRSLHDPDSAKVRRGKVGGYRDYLPADAQERLEEMCVSYGL